MDTRHSPKSDGLVQQAWMAGVSLLLACMQFRVIMLVQESNYGASISAAQGVVQGLPHWVIYQSRVLGPWMVELLSRLDGNFQWAYVYYVIATTAGAGWLILTTVRRRFGTDAGWGALFLFHMLFSALLSKLWLYAWDHIGLIVFTLFVRFVMDGKGTRWFLALFAVAIFNRESALYIALWMVLDPLIKAVFDRTPPRLTMPLCGAACLGAGLVVIGMLRRLLLVREIGPELYDAPELAGKTVHIKWEQNLAYLQTVLTTASFTFEFVIVVFLLAVVALAVVLAVRDPRRYLALSVVHLALIASILVAGLVQETRVMLELVPLVCLGVWAVQRTGAEPRAL